MKVSVLITCYNGMPYIKDVLNFLNRQTFKDFEIVVVDDGSTDGTFLFLKEYNFSENKITIFSNPNKGRGKALNLGLKHCVGEYIAINDSDDFSLINRLEKQVYFLDNNREYGLVGSMSVLRMLDTGNIIEHSHDRPIENEDIRKYFIKGQPIQHVTVMFRKDLALKVGGYNEHINFLFDRDIFLKFALHSKLYNLNEVLVEVGEHNKRFFKSNFYGLQRAWYNTKYQMQAVHQFGFNPLLHFLILGKYFWTIMIETTINKFK
jgi:glycosyltransferase involved in cell wall biosynthesis